MNLASTIDPARAIEELPGLLEDLQEAGYPVGLDEYLKSRDLIVALAARGEPVDQAGRLEVMLRPVLCGTPREQKDFSDHFRNWVETTQKETAPPPPLPTERMTEQIRRKSVWLTGALTAAGIVILLFILSKIGQDAVTEKPAAHPKPPPIDIPGYNWWDYTLELNWRLIGLGLAGLAVATILLIAVWRHWWRRQAKLFLSSRSAAEPPDLRRIPIRGLQEQILPPLLFMRIAREFRRRVTVPVRRLDVDNTLRHSFRAGGWLTPVWSTRKAPPEYLVLIDRSSLEDYQARLHESMIAQLASQDVFVSVYSFDEDPRICFDLDDEEAEPVTLEELAGKRAHHRLLLFTAPASLIDPAEGGLAEWTPLLAAWENRALLTTRDLVNDPFVPVVETALPVYPAEPLALERAVRSFHQPEKSSGAAAALAARDRESDGASFPRELRIRSRRWISRNQPEKGAVDRLLAQLRLYLGEDGYLWLCACAVYPELHWNLTVHLGNALRTRESDDVEAPDDGIGEGSIAGRKGEPVLSFESLSRMARLPWFRHGTMPEWLRERFLADLDPVDEAEVRQIIQALLLSAAEVGEDATGDDFILEIAKEKEKSSLAPLIGPLFELLKKSDAAYEDHVFMSFMSTRRANRLAVAAPEGLAQLIEGVREAKLNPVKALRTVLGMALGYALSGAAAGWMMTFLFDTVDEPSSNVLLFLIGSLLIALPLFIGGVGILITDSLCIRPLKLLKWFRGTWSILLAAALLGGIPFGLVALYEEFYVSSLVLGGFVWFYLVSQRQSRLLKALFRKTVWTLPVFLGTVIAFVVHSIFDLSAENYILFSTTLFCGVGLFRGLAAMRLNDLTPNEVPFRDPWLRDFWNFIRFKSAIFTVGTFWEDRFFRTVTGIVAIWGLGSIAALAVDDYEFEGIVGWAASILSFFWLFLSESITRHRFTGKGGLRWLWEWIPGWVWAGLPGVFLAMAISESDILGGSEFFQSPPYVLLAGCSVGILISLSRTFTMKRYLRHSLWHGIWIGIAMGVAFLVSVIVFNYLTDLDSTLVSVGFSAVAGVAVYSLISGFFAAKLVQAPEMRAVEVAVPKLGRRWEVVNVIVHLLIPGILFAVSDGNKIRPWAEPIETEVWGFATISIIHLGIIFLVQYVQWHFFKSQLPSFRLSPTLWAGTASIASVMIFVASAISVGIEDPSGSFAVVCSYFFYFTTAAFVLFILLPKGFRQTLRYWGGTMAGILIGTIALAFHFSAAPAAPATPAAPSQNDPSQLNLPGAGPEQNTPSNKN